MIYLRQQRSEEYFSKNLVITLQFIQLNVIRFRKYRTCFSIRMGKSASTCVIRYIGMLRRRKGGNF